MQNGRIISEQQVHDAVEFLRAGAAEIGKAKGRAVKADAMLGHTEALCVTYSSATSAAAKQADARSSTKYLEAIDKKANAAAQLEELKGLREAAVMLIEVWRSEQATYRSTKL